MFCTLLFCFYITDLPNVSEILSCALFAYDTTLFLFGKNGEKPVGVANAKLGGVSDYTKANMLSLNVDFFAELFQ